MDHFEWCFMSMQVTFVRVVRCVWVEITVYVNTTWWELSH